MSTIPNIIRGRVSDRKLALLRCKIEDINITARVRNTIIRDGVWHKDEAIRTLKDLASKTKQQILAIEGIGEESIKELESYLRCHELEFGMTFEERAGSLFVVDPTERPSPLEPLHPQPRLKDLIGCAVRVYLDVPGHTTGTEYRVLGIEDGMICLKEEGLNLTIWTGFRDLTFLVVPDTPEP